MPHNGNYSSTVRRIAHVSLLITLSVVIRNFSYMFYIGGVGAIRVSFSGVFTRMAAIIFGPFYGGLASGIQDILGYLIKPEGPFIPWLTVSAVASGALAGFLWRITENADHYRWGRYFLLFFACIGLIGGTNQLVISLWPYSAWAMSLEAMGNSKKLVSEGLILFAAIGMGLYLLDVLLRRISEKWRIKDYFFRVLFAAGLSGLFLTTVNTWIIRLTFPELAEINFLVFWIPRVIKEALVVVIQSYVISFLLAVYNRYFRIGPAQNRQVR